LIVASVHISLRQWFRVHNFWSLVWGSVVIFDRCFWAYLSESAVIGKSLGHHFWSLISGNRAHHSENRQKTRSLFLIVAFAYICRRQRFIVHYFMLLVWGSVIIFDHCLRAHFSERARLLEVVLSLRQGHYFWSLLLGTFFREGRHRSKIWSLFLIVDCGHLQSYLFYYWSLVWGSFHYRQKEVVIIFDRCSWGHYFERGSLFVIVAFGCIILWAMVQSSLFLVFGLRQLSSPAKIESLTHQRVETVLRWGILLHRHMMISEHWWRINTIIYQYLLWCQLGSLILVVSLGHDPTKRSLFWAVFFILSISHYFWLPILVQVLL